MDSSIKKIIQAKTIKYDMKLSKILKYIFVKICNINQNKYYILGSYALREHRPINDLDINLDSKEFMKLENATQKGLGKIEFYNNQIRWTIDLTKEYNKLTNSKVKDFSIEAFMKEPDIGFPNKNFSLKYLKKTRGLDKDKNNHQFYKLKTLLKWKKTMNREKDRKDIELINKILKK